MSKPNYVSGFVNQELVILWIFSLIFCSFISNYLGYQRGIQVASQDNSIQTQLQ